MVESRVIDPQARKARGVYYTSGPVLPCMVSLALRSVLARGARGKVLRVLDPSCGEGAFLVQVVRTIRDLVVRGLFPRGRVITLAGIDIDGAAIAIARQRLEAELDALHDVGCGFEIDLQQGNALFDINGDTGRHEVDVIIGNPPYVPWNAIPASDRTWLEYGSYLGVPFDCRPNHDDAQPNYYLFFLVLACCLVASHGVICFLLPKEWLQHARAAAFRKFLVDRVDTVSVLEFDPSTKLFDAGTTSMVLLLEMNDACVPRGLFHHASLPGTGLEHVLARIAAGEPTCCTCKAPGVPGAPWCFEGELTQHLGSLVDRVDTVALKDRAAFHVFGGFQPPVQFATQFELDLVTLEELDPLERARVVPVVHDASGITRYVLTSQDRYWIVANDLDSEAGFKDACPRLHDILAGRIQDRHGCWWHFPNVRNFHAMRTAREKLLAPRTAPVPTFAIDTGQHVFKGTNTAIIPKHESMPVMYLAGILNSSLSTAWYRAFGPRYHGGRVMRFEPAMVQAHGLPVVVPGKQERARAVNLVLVMVDEIRAGRVDEQARLQAKLDDLVLAIYDVPATTRDLITGVADR